MDINQLRTLVNSMSRDELQDFHQDAAVRYGANQLLGKFTGVHLLAAADQLVDEQLAALGIQPRSRTLRKVKAINSVSKPKVAGGRSGRVMVTKVSQEEMEKLWK